MRQHDNRMVNLNHTHCSAVTAHVLARMRACTANHTRTHTHTNTHTMHTHKYTHEHPHSCTQTQPYPSLLPYSRAHKHLRVIKQAPDPMMLG